MGLPTGDPAEVGRGIYVDHVIDFSIPVKYGLSLTVDRIYSSVNYTSENLAHDTMFGPHWFSGYEAHLYDAAPGTGHPFVLVSETGEWHHFTIDTGDTYYSRLDQGEPLRLDVDEMDADETYRVTSASGRQLRFNVNGQLTFIDPDIRTAADESIELEYDGEDRLWKVHAPGSDDRYLEFDYWVVDSLETRQVKTVALKTAGETYPLLWYWYGGEDGQLDFVKTNDIDNTHATYYEYGNLNAAMDDVDTIDPPLLGRVSYYSGGTRKSISGVHYTGIEFDNLHYLHPTELYVWDTNTSDWVQTHKIDYADGYLRDVYFGDGEGDDPRASYIVDHQRDFQDVWFSDLTDADSSTAVRTDPRDHEEEGEGEGVPRLRTSGSRYDEADSAWYKEWEKIYDLDNADPLYAFRLLEQSTHLAKEEDTPSTTTYTYQSLAAFKGHLRSVEGPTGETTVWKYFGDLDNNGSLDGGISTGDAEYGRLAEVVSPGNISTTYSYYTSGNRAGLLATVTTPDGITEFDYNDRGEVIEVVSPDDTVVTKTYNDFGQATSVSTSHLSTIDYIYSDDTDLPDAEEYLPPRLVAVHDGVTTNSHYLYTETREVEEIEDALGNSTFHTYDLRGRLASTYRVVNSVPETVEYGYNVYDQLVSFEDGLDNETTYEYDEFGRLRKETDPDSYYSQYWYGASGGGGCGCGAGGANSVARIRKPDGTYVSFSYDWAGRLEDVDYESIGTSGSYEITFAHDLAGRVLSLSDTRLNLGDETYSWTYDSGGGSGETGRLLSLEHPEGYTQEYFYDADGKVEAYRDVDGGLIEYDYDGLGRLDDLTDPFLGNPDWVYAGTGDTYYPISAVKSLTYSNTASNHYEYDTLGRMDKVTFKDGSSTVLDFVDLVYNNAGLITEKARKNPYHGSNHRVTYYDYDEAYRLIEEITKITSTTYDTRLYEYDAAGNRTEMTKDSVTTTYDYGDRNEIEDSSWYNTLGGTSSGNVTYTFNSNGNMTYRGMSSMPSMEWGYSWNEDNRLVSVSYAEDHDPVYAVSYKYDAAGRRLLKQGRTDGAGERTRYFFHGLTEEITKRSVANSHNDSAFEFTEKEDGVSAADWTVTGSGAAVAAQADTPRRSSVIKFTSGTGLSGWSFSIGRNGSSGTSWNETKRILSFWLKDDSLRSITVHISTSGGNGTVIYRKTTGSNTYNSTTRAATIFLGGGVVDSTDWLRFEHNVEADFESLSGATTWTDIDGFEVVSFTPSDTYYVDQIRLSNSQTVEHNVLGPGVIGHILRNRTINPTTYAATDKYFHYDQVGSVMLETNSGGTSASSHWPDAFGLLAEGWSGATTFDGLWKNASGQAGWHFQSKEFDEDAGLVYFHKRWYNSAEGTFLSRAPFDPRIEKQYLFGEQSPVDMIDPFGMKNYIGGANQYDIINGLTLSPDDFGAAVDCYDSSVRTSRHAYGVISKPGLSELAVIRKQNAVRHCVLACCLQMNMSAESVVDRTLGAHELGSRGKADSSADEANNEAGKMAGNACPPEGCYGRCMAMLNKGLLWQSDGKGGDGIVQK